VKRFLLASVMAMTVTATATTVFADEPAAAPTTTATPTVAPTPAPTATPTATATATTAAPAYHPPPAATTPPAVVRAPVVTAPTPSPVAAPAATIVPVVAPVVAPVPAPEPAAPAATPLAVRPAPAKPLALAPASEGLGVGYKLLAIVAIGGAVALYLKKKRGAKIAASAPSKIDILSRASIGVRSQLVVVEVEGTRLLVGMTPNTIQTLAVLQTPEDDGVAAMDRAAAVEDRVEIEMMRPANLGDRVRSLLGADEPIMPRLSSVKPGPDRAPKPRAARTNPRPAAARAKTEPRDSREVAGQARGLLLSVDEDT
jgi:flagellar biogenesis protein FliO